ncbi:MAG: efflux RND transporter periplasmic adaptor subunit [Victivallaceae bacterium]|nr:efflux RND transporter periplasmic adaptor subunit [Victivallaceae bacterium]
MKTGLCMAAALAFLAVGCEKQKVKETPVPTVVVAPAESGRAADCLQVIGQVVADQEVALIARVNGFLEQRNFREGEVVKKGTLLYLIEPDQYKADVDSATAALARAKASAANAEVEEARQKELWEKQAASKKDYDNAHTRALEASANVKVCAASLEQAQLNLSYTKITAPFDGRMGLTLFDVGDMVGPESGPLDNIVSITPARVKFKLNEAMLLRLNDNRLNKSGSSLLVRLFFSDGSEYNQTGNIAYWDNRVSSTTGTIEIQALFPNEEGVLVPGMNVRVSLESADSPPVVLVPAEAVQEDQLGFFVYLVEAGKAVRREVSTGDTVRGKTVIYSGVNIGDQVVVEGLQRIRNGLAVNTQTEAERAAQQSAVISKIAGEKPAETKEASVVGDAAVTEAKIGIAPEEDKPAAAAAENKAK